MALFKCKMCGGALELSGSETVATCEYCGTQQTLPRLDNDRKANLYDRANHFRRNNEFDRAMGIYDQILGDDNTDAEAYWSLVLCRYGIEYVEDPVSRKRIPTVNRAQFTSVFDDESYKCALQYADAYQKHIYEAEAKTIDDIQKGILAISQKEDPFDVFICYKETDQGGRRTMDSVLAQDLYTQLTQGGFKVFFARITLEDKLGSAYEPYIFAALNSAKVMVVLGTRPEHFNAVWVRNEWSRYLSLIRQGQKKTLIPAYRDMDPYDLPEEFSHLQAQDMSKLGFMQDLTRGIAKIVQADRPVVEVKSAAVQANAEAMSKRAAIFLEDGNTERAAEYCEKALDVDPECADAYALLLMIDMGVRTRDQLGNCDLPFDSNPNYQKAVRFGSAPMKEELSGYITHIKERNELARLEGIYSSAVNKMKTSITQSAFISLAEQLESIPQYKDSAELAQLCRAKAEDARKDAILAEGKACMANYRQTIENYQAAIEAFKKIPGWKDADEQLVLCEQKIQQLTAKAEADRLERDRQLELAREEAEKRAKRNKKLAIILSSAALLIIACIVVWITVLSPMLQYNKAEELLGSGSFDEAIALFAELEDYKDAAQRIPEAKYAKAEKLLSDGEYDAAIAIFAELADYSDAAARISEATYNKAGTLAAAGEYEQAEQLYLDLGDYSDSSAKYAATLLAHVTALVDGKDYANAEELMGTLSKYDEHKAALDALYVRLVDIYYARSDYEKALEAYKKTADYAVDTDRYKDINYKLARQLFDQKRYSLAKAKFQNLPGYLDSDQMVIETDYQWGIESVNEKNYSTAINTFARIIDYKDSKERINDAKYRFVLANKSSDNSTTYTYLKDLKAIKYKDSVDIFKTLYAWKVTIVANDDENNETTNMTSISKYSNWYFHIKLTGGEPGASVTLRYSGLFPDGSTHSNRWDGKWQKNWSGYCYFWYNNPAYGKQGTFRLRIYDDKNNLIGEHTVRITG